MHWLDFVVLVLASSAIVDVWRNGSLFTDWRALFQALSDTSPGGTSSDTEVLSDMPQPDPLPIPQRWVVRYAPAWLGELLSCAFCFSYHAPWIAYVIWLLPKYEFGSGFLMTCWTIPLYALAATRLGNIINSFLPDESKYQR